ncbi:putative serine/threonine-protein kinase [Tetrabaena socialis]|uniref:Putative serine/threonine-protein kinase n=1 Tax=Tetrabaena socialis TaxID=47790 RepID=A0A2J8A1B3_9CHLO|nr:putative serine/threonine-protein kinase [Tetrabaena socialis]|eukprot:PNH06312.1 putative serine/threonine-protein kinase [Tetrabaena socialis]
MPSKKKKKGRQRAPFLPNVDTEEELLALAAIYEDLDVHADGTGFSLVVVPHLQPEENYCSVELSVCVFNLVDLVQDTLRAANRKPQPGQGQEQDGGGQVEGGAGQQQEDAEQAPHAQSLWHAMQRRDGNLPPAAAGGLERTASLSNSVAAAAAAAAAAELSFSEELPSVGLVGGLSGGMWAYDVGGLYDMDDISGDMDGAAAGMFGPPPPPAAVAAVPGRAAAGAAAGVNGGQGAGVEAASGAAAAAALAGAAEAGDQEEEGAGRRGARGGGAQGGRAGGRAEPSQQPQQRRVPSAVLAKRLPRAMRALVASNSNSLTLGTDHGARSTEGDADAGARSLARQGRKAAGRPTGGAHAAARGRAGDDLEADRGNSGSGTSSSGPSGSSSEESTSGSGSGGAGGGGGVGGSSSTATTSTSSSDGWDEDGGVGGRGGGGWRRGAGPGPGRGRRVLGGSGLGGRSYGGGAGGGGQDVPRSGDVKLQLLLGHLLTMAAGAGAGSGPGADARGSPLEALCSHLRRRGLLPQWLQWLVTKEPHLFDRAFAREFGQRTPTAATPLGPRRCCRLDGRQYAVKKIKLHSASPASYARITREVATLSRLQHPNVVRYFQSHRPAGTSTTSKKGADFGSRPALPHAPAVPPGLAHIHAMGVIHRDLKPANIFFGANGELKLGDFGLAKFHSGPSDEGQAAAATGAAAGGVEAGAAAAAPGGAGPAGLHPPGAPGPGPGPGAGLSWRAGGPQPPDATGPSDRTGVCGSYYYISPEIKNGWARYDEKVDLWSLGVVLFELWHPLATGMERAVLLHDLRDHGRLPEAWERAHPRVARLIRWLMAPNPGERPSAREVLASDLLPPRLEDEQADLDLLHPAPAAGGLAAAADRGRLLAEAEALKAVTQVLDQFLPELGRYEVRLNHRAIERALYDSIGLAAGAAAAGAAAAAGGGGDNAGAAAAAAAAAGAREVEVAARRLLGTALRGSPLVGAVRGELRYKAWPSVKAGLEGLGLPPDKVASCKRCACELAGDAPTALQRLRAFLLEQQQAAQQTQQQAQQAQQQQAQQQQQAAGAAGAGTGAAAVQRSPAKVLGGAKAAASAGAPAAGGRTAAAAASGGGRGGGGGAVSSSLSAALCSALDEVAALLQLLDVWGIPASQVVLDPLMAPTAEYYSGITFQVHLLGLPAAPGQGGGVAGAGAAAAPASHLHLHPHALPAAPLAPGLVAVGGRYDALLRALWGPAHAAVQHASQQQHGAVPPYGSHSYGSLLPPPGAVGATLNVERLIGGVSQQRAAAAAAAGALGGSGLRSLETSVRRSEPGNASAAAAPTMPPRDALAAALGPAGARATAVPAGGPDSDGSAGAETKQQQQQQQQEPQPSEPPDLLTPQQANGGAARRGALTRSNSAPFWPPLLTGDSADGPSGSARIRLGICAMARKAASRPMREILRRLTCCNEFELLVFEERLQRRVLYGRGANEFELLVFEERSRHARCPRAACSHPITPAKRTPHLPACRPACPPQPDLYDARVRPVRPIRLRGAVQVILGEPVERWPAVDCLLAWQSEGFPLAKAQPAFLDLYERHADPSKKPGPTRQAKLKSASQLQVQGGYGRAHCTACCRTRGV